MKYIYDINLISYLLMKGLEIEEIKMNTTTNKLQFMFRRSVLLDELINEYKFSTFKEYANCQNVVRRIIHSGKL
ncbi:DUF5659 domain-containing protein [Paenibacillus sp. FSL H3-0286]|uniref:DUF5659 domain-containing protein n=1 Tax=Paenibacillus sp. FSL H3-0286 TaxID=2921427 RepID=UPI00386D49FA